MNKLTFFIITLIIGLIVVLTFIAIYFVAKEEIHYTKKDKLKKILFIIFVPIYGAISELNKLDDDKRFVDKKPVDDGYICGSGYISDKCPDFSSSDGGGE